MRRNERIQSLIVTCVRSGNRIEMKKKDKQFAEEKKRSKTERERKNDVAQNCSTECIIKNDRLSGRNHLDTFL